MIDLSLFLAQVADILRELSTESQSSDPPERKRPALEQNESDKKRYLFFEILEKITLKNKNTRPIAGETQSGLA